MTPRVESFDKEATAFFKAELFKEHFADPPKPAKGRGKGRGGRGSGRRGRLLLGGKQQQREERQRMHASQA